MLAKVCNKLPSQLRILVMHANLNQQRDLIERRGSSASMQRASPP